MRVGLLTHKSLAYTFPTKSNTVAKTVGNPYSATVFEYKY